MTVNLLFYPAKIQDRQEVLHIICQSVHYWQRGPDLPSIELTCYLAKTFWTLCKRIDLNLDSSLPCKLIYLKL